MLGHMQGDVVAHIARGRQLIGDSPTEPKRYAERPMFGTEAVVLVHPLYLVSTVRHDASIVHDHEAHELPSVDQDNPGIYP